MLRKQYIKSVDLMEARDSGLSGHSEGRERNEAFIPTAWENMI